MLVDWFVHVIRRRLLGRFFPCQHPFTQPLYGFERTCLDCGEKFRGISRAQ